MSLSGRTLPRLGVNIDHVATIRNARGGAHPDPLRAALLAVQAGADGITAHLREDRRHIGDADIERLLTYLEAPLNLEMAATEEMLEIALRHGPHACCIVPEKRRELTTEGGLDAAGGHNHLAPFVRRLNDRGVRVSFFIDPDEVQVDAAAGLQAAVVELHTGAYCQKVQDGDELAVSNEIRRLKEAAAAAQARGLEVHAGHGLSFDTVGVIAEIPQVRELNIGHFLVGEAIFSGLDSAIKRMQALMARAWADVDRKKMA